jgi:arginase family enzyme
MVVAMYLGKTGNEFIDLKARNLSPENVFIWGVQNNEYDFYLSDEREEENLRKWGIPYITIQDIEKDKNTKCINHELESLFKRSDEVYFSLDLDLIDQKECPGVAMPNPKGFSVDQLKQVINYIKSNTQISPLTGMSIVEIDPTKDNKNTARIAIETIKAIINDL